MSAVRYILYVDPVDTGSVKALKSAAQARWYPNRSCDLV